MPKEKKMLSSKARKERAFMRLQTGLAVVYALFIGYGIATNIETGWLVYYFAMLFFCTLNAVWCRSKYHTARAQEEKNEQFSSERSSQKEKTLWLTSSTAQNTLSYRILAEAGIIRPDLALAKPSELERQLEELTSWVSRETPKPRPKKSKDKSSYSSRYDHDDYYEELAERKMTKMNELVQPVIDGLARYIEAEKQSQKALEPKDFAVDPQNHTPEEWEILRRYFEAAKPIEAKLGVENVSDTYQQYAHDALIDLAANTAEELTQLHAVKQTMADNELLNAITSSGTRAALY